MHVFSAISLIAASAVLPAYSQLNFAAPKAFEDPTPQQVLKADFNRDGRTDLVTIDIGSVNLYLNQGKGRFHPAQVISKGNGTSAALGDFNGDGKLDIAVLNFSLGGVPGSFFVLLGNGDGTFQQTATITTDETPEVILVADYTGDGKPDVAVISNSIQVFPGLGDGTFGAPQSTAVPVLLKTAVTADFTGDGKPDIVIGNLFNQFLYVYSGNGDGTFSLVNTLTLDGPTWGLSTGDLNHDNKPDLIAAVNTSVEVVLGHGDGTFSAPTAYGVAGYALNSAIADVNRDGKPDLVVACSDLSVLLGNGDGTFQSPVSTYFGTSAATVITGDFNGDGQVDAVFTEQFTTELATGDGTGQFTAAPQLGTFATPSAVFIGNFLGNGNNDVVALNGAISVYPAEGGGAFGDRSDITVNYFGPNVGAKVDVNGDGLPDLVVAGSHSIRGGAPDGLQVFFGQKGTTLAGGPAYENLGFSARSMATADFNNDGKPDLVITSGNPAGYVIAAGDGKGGFQFSSLVSVSGSQNGVDVADFDHDGNIDFATTQGVLLFLGNGKGTFA